MTCPRLPQSTLLALATCRLRKVQHAAAHFLRRISRSWFLNPYFHFLCSSQLTGATQQKAGEAQNQAGEAWEQTKNKAGETWEQTKQKTSEVRSSNECSSSISETRLPAFPFHLNEISIDTALTIRSACHGHLLQSARHQSPSLFDPLTAGHRHHPAEGWPGPEPGWLCLGADQG